MLKFEEGQVVFVGADETEVVLTQLQVQAVKLVVNAMMK